MACVAVFDGYAFHRREALLVTHPYEVPEHTLCVCLIVQGLDEWLAFLPVPLVYVPYIHLLDVRAVHQQQPAQIDRSVRGVDASAEPVFP